MRLEMSVPLVLAGIIVVLVGFWVSPNEEAPSVLRVAFWGACASVWLTSLAQHRR